MKLEVEGEIPRPDRLEGITYQKDVSCGHLFITINEDSDSRPFEIFITLGKGGLCKSCLMGTIARMISHDLQKGLNLQNHINIFRGVRCDKSITGMNNHGNSVLSCPDAIGQILELHLDKKCLKHKEGRILCWRDKIRGKCPECDKEKPKDKKNCGKCAILLKCWDGYNTRCLGYVKPEEKVIVDGK